MAKSDKPLDKILLSSAYRPPRKPPWAEGKDINGFDTETADGRPFMLSVAWEGFGGAAFSNDHKPLTPEYLFKYLTHKRARSALNVWYNLNFDANVMLNAVLNEDQLAELSTTNQIETEDYEIMYVPSKFLRIKEIDNRNVYTHYDASQFFYGSLEAAAREWLGEDKLTETVDVTKFALDGQEVNDYIKDNWRQIETYAQKDAVLVRDLWAEAVSVAEDLNIPMGRPFSTGYLAESYLNYRLDEKPGIGPRSMARLAWESYKGGRFEVIKRGNVGPVAGPDINSAYPHIISNLPDPKTLNWRRYDNPSIQGLKDADYGFVKVEVTTDKSRAIQPFAVKIDGKLKYPALVGQEVSTLKDIFLHAYENGYIEDYEIKEAWLGYTNHLTDYPFTFVEQKYTERKDFEAEGKVKAGQFLKIVLNSMYGKTCQTTPKRQRVEDNIHIEDKFLSHVPSLALPEQLRERYESGFIEWLQAGAWFNPFLAAYITGMTRLELHKQVVNYGLEDHTIMLATDSLMIERGPFEASKFADDLVKDGLGNWDYDYRGRAFVVGAGVYQIDFDTCQKKACPGYGDYSLQCEALGHTRKEKTRGFREADLGHTSLKYAAAKANGKIKIESVRPKTIAEAIWQNQPLSQVGQFLEYERSLSPDMDDKRAWEAPATFPNLLDGVITSKPLVLSA